MCLFKRTVIKITEAQNWSIGRCGLQSLSQLKNSISRFIRFCPVLGLQQILVETHGADRWGEGTPTTVQHLCCTLCLLPEGSCSIFHSHTYRQTPPPRDMPVKPASRSTLPCPNLSRTATSLWSLVDEHPWIHVEILHALATRPFYFGETVHLREWSKAGECEIEVVSSTFCRHTRIKLYKKHWMYHFSSAL